MTIERHYGTIDLKGNFVFTERNQMRFENAVRNLSGKDFELEIREVQSHATESQYAYFRKAIITICLAAEMFGGWDEDEIINHFTDRFLRTVKLKQAGKLILGISSTRKIENLSKKSMSKFIDDVLNWLSTNGISVGTPEEYFLNR